MQTHHFSHKFYFANIIQGPIDKSAMEFSSQKCILNLIT